MLLTALLAVSMTLGGCTGESDSTSSTASRKPLTIWWAEWAPADGLQQLAGEFEKETGIAVTVHQIPWSSFQDQVFLNFGGKQTDFDIVVGDSQWIGRGATNKLYVDLTDWLSSAIDLKQVHPLALKYLCEYPTGSGRYFSAPCETDAIGFAYRKDWFDDPKEKAAFKTKFGRELQVPQTWEEFRDVAEFFTRSEQKRYGCAILTGHDYDSLTMGFQQLMWAFGGSWGDPQTFKVDGHVNSAGTLAAVMFMKDLLKYSPPGGSNFSYDKTIESFKNNSVAMAMDYFAFFPDLTRVMKDRVGYFVIPAKDGKRFVSLGGQGMSISTKIPLERQEDAKKFIAWFCKPSTQGKWITKDAGFTANTEILKSDAFRRATPYNAPLADSLDHVRDFWNVPVYNELLAASQRHLAEAIEGTDPQASLDALAKAQEQIMKSLPPFPTGRGPG
jgi:multiple sugar transport system substrate-binding protein